jgi:hypothetical protein
MEEMSQSMTIRRGWRSRQLVEKRTISTLSALREGSLLFENDTRISEGIIAVTSLTLEARIALGCLP